MTEEDAKTKWCPFARIASPMVFKQPGSTREEWVGVAGANRGALSERIAVQGASDASNPESARCIGSACMAWRWSPCPDLSGAVALADCGEKLNAIKALRTLLPEVTLRDAKEIVEGVQPWPRHGGGGFCGLAGQP